MCNYLTKRGSTYYFRRKTPLDLIEIYGKEITFSLKTKDRNEAAGSCRAEAVKLDNEFKAHRAIKNIAPIPTPQKEISTLPKPAVTPIDINADIHLMVGRLRANRRTASLEGRLSDWHDNLRHHVKMYQDQLRTGMHPLFEPDPDIVYAEVFVKAANHILDDAPLPFTSLLESHTATVTTQSISAPKSQNKIPNQITFTSAIDSWAIERKPVPRTIKHMRRVAGLLSDTVNTPYMNLVTKKDVIAFKNNLAATESSAANINNYLSLLRTLYNHAISEDRLTLNPALGIKVPTTTSAKTARLPFDNSDLIKIFSSRIYSANFRPLGGKGEAAYWIPLIALFTGARLEEIAQLRSVDIIERTYSDSTDNQMSCWVIHITDEGEGQHLKNQNSRRIIPIHTVLLELGFLDYVNAHTGFIFPHLLPTKEYQVRSGNWSKWFSNHLRKEINITDPRLVFHSFRHTFKELCRNSNIETEVHHALTGHSMGNVGDNYGGHYYPLAPLVTAINKFRVPGIDAIFISSQNNGK